MNLHKHTQGTHTQEIMKEKTRIVTEKLRGEIFDMIMTLDETNYFMIDNFRSRYNLKKSEMKTMLDIVISELTKLGWKYQTSFGGTGLFIYSTDNPPRNCYPDEF